MSGHTPGPWRAYSESSREWCVEAESKGIACTETEADARLIAAAPELFERLKFAAHFLERFQAGDHPTEYSGEALRRIQETIAKAEGRS